MAYWPIYGFSAYYSVQPWLWPSWTIITRFEILKSRLLFLKTTLNEKPDSQIYKVLQLQFQNPIKGDWASTCLQDIKDLEMDITLEEIKTVSLFKFKRLLKKHIDQKALKYLKGKQGSKKWQSILCPTVNAHQLNNRDIFLG